MCECANVRMRKCVNMRARNVPICKCENGPESELIVINEGVTENVAFSRSGTSYFVIRTP